MVILRNETIIIVNLIACISMFTMHMFFANFNRKLYFSKNKYIKGYILYLIVTTSIGIWMPPFFEVGSILSAIILGHCLYNDEKIYYIYYGIFMVILLVGQLLFSEVFKLIIDGLSIGMQSIDIYLIANAIIIQIANLAVCRLVITLFKTNIKELNMQQYFSFMFLPIFSFIYIITLVNFIQKQWTIDYTVDLIIFIINLCLIVFFNIFITNIFTAISKNNELKNKVELYEKQTKMEYEYYAALEEKYKNSRKIIHDVKNHMQTIDSLYDAKENEEAKKYLKGMYGLLDTLVQKIYTDNKILNIVINDKVNLAKKNEIDIKVLIGDVDLSFIDEIDITTIISNLLDNAIDATKETENREILLKVDKFNSFLVINVVNSFKKVKIIDKDFKTTKTNHMGLGLKNIEMTVEKYLGTMSIKMSEKLFKINIMIPN